MSDLVGGKYPQQYPFWKALGQAANATQGNLSVRSNAEYLGLGGLTDQTGVLSTGKAILVPVPVEIGDVITKVSVLAGATAEATGTHAWAACYSGALTTAALLGAQSTDNTGAAAIAASARFDFTLGTSFTVSAANAPFGYIYAAISVTATTVPSLVSSAVAAATQYAWFTNTPLLGANSGSALAGTAPATFTLASSTAQANTPLVFLS